MKKVLFVLNNMNIGGTEKAFLNMLDTMPPVEYDVTLLLLEKSGGFLPMVPDWVHIEVIDDYKTMKPEIMDPPLKIAKNYIKSGMIRKAFGIALTHLLFKITDDRTLYYRYVLKGKQHLSEYDVAIAYCGPFDFLTVYVLFFVKAKEKIQWIHFDVSKFQFNTKMCSRLYKKFDNIYVVSNEARLELLKKIPNIESKTKTYLNVVSRKKCQEMAEMGAGFIDEYCGKRIVTIGRLSQEKGQDIIPQIVKVLSDKNVEFRWYLIGDGKIRSLVEEVSKNLGVADKIVFLGTQTNPYQFLKGADLYVQTSKHEGYCITLAEARAFGLSIVSTECAGAHEQLDGLDNCCVVNRDVDEMSKAIEALLTSQQFV